MKTALIILSFVALIGCGKDINTEKDAELSTYVNHFLYITDSELGNLVSWRFSDSLEADQVAVVNTISYADGTVIKELLVNSNKWPSMSEVQREATMAHEMMHAIFDADHTNDGLMHPYNHITTKAVVQYGLIDAIFNAIKKKKLK